MNERPTPKVGPDGRLPDDHVVAVFRFTMPDGSILEREWTVGDGKGPLLVPPTWLKNARRAWDHPQDPITFTGEVEPGHEDEARTALKIEAA